MHGNHLRLEIRSFVIDCVCVLLSFAAMAPKAKAGKGAGKGKGKEGGKGNKGGKAKADKGGKGKAGKGGKGKAGKAAVLKRPAAKDPKVEEEGGADTRGITMAQRHVWNKALKSEAFPKDIKDSYMQARYEQKDLKKAHPN